jgi:polysaccharide biosynthesis protein PslH
MPPIKILQICFRPQIPANDGGAIAMYNISQGFSKNKEVDLSVFVINTPKHNVSIEAIQIEFGINKVVSCFVDTSINPFKAMLSLFGTKSYNLERFNNQLAKDKLQVFLSENHFDLVHFEGLYASPLLETVRQFAPNSKAVLRSHNIESLIWQRRANQAKSFLKKWYLNNLTKKLKRYEDEIISQFDAVIPITEVDYPYFEQMNAKEIYTSSTGVQLDNYNVQMPIDQNAVFHLGSLDWMPNQEAVVWFFEKVWPKVITEVPKARFYLAGKNMPDWFKKYKSQSIKILGQVESAPEFMSSHGIMVVPLLSGSGMRIKIIEGMACGCPIVSTSIGAEGIHCHPEKDILLANDVDGFAKAVILLLTDINKAEELGVNARLNIEQHYSNIAKTDELLDFYKKILV